MLTIAHRVHTILDSDRIMVSYRSHSDSTLCTGIMTNSCATQVLDKGKIAEFDGPKCLLSNPGSNFSRLLAESATAGDEVSSSAAKK